MHKIPLSNFLSALSTVLHWVLNAVIILSVLRGYLIWIDPEYTGTTRFLYQITQLVFPMLNAINKTLPATIVDYSPIVAIVVMVFLKIFVADTFTEYATNLKNSIIKEQNSPSQYASTNYINPNRNKASEIKLNVTVSPPSHNSPAAHDITDSTEEERTASQSEQPARSRVGNDEPKRTAPSEKA
jgi:uncharacterized protein YggT (Ycf19 family)